MTQTNWIFYSPDEQKSKEFAEELKISAFTSQILLNRNIKTIQEGQAFLHPIISSLPSATSIPNLKEAVNFIYDAIKANKKFIVYGDYDVDGITGTSMLIMMLMQFGVHVEYYIPHRYTEGYGINLEALEKIAAKKFDILVTVDCGVSNVKEIAKANELGMQVVVIDHHTPPRELPPAVVIVDPKLNQQPDAPYYNLAGVGIAYKLAEYLFEIAGKDLQILQDFGLELVALGTISDIVPLLKENRTLTYFGLANLCNSRNLGINQLKKVSSLKNKVNTYGVGYILGPRLNAAGRLEHASLGVDLIMTKDQQTAETLARKLHTINENRKQSGKHIKEDILKKIREEFNPADKKCIVVANENWHPGIIGIVSSQIAKEFCRPTVLISINEGKGRGSARSIFNIDVFTPLNECRHFFEDFGGHKEAAGFEIKTENIPAFKKFFEQALDKYISFEDLQPFIRIDMELKPENINIKLAKEISMLEPFGQSNPEPIFFTRNIFPIDYKLVGDGSHLSVTLSDGYNTFQAIGFGMNKEVHKLKADTVDIVYHLKINDWKKNQDVQLQLIDIRESNTL